VRRPSGLAGSEKSRAIVAQFKGLNSELGTSPCIGDPFLVQMVEPSQ
jgi:hypothetical protein